MLGRRPIAAQVENLNVQSEAPVRLIHLLLCLVQLAKGVFVSLIKLVKPILTGFRERGVVDVLGDPLQLVRGHPILNVE